MFNLPGIGAIGVNVLVQRLLDCKDDAKANRLMETLISEHAMPLFREVMARKNADPAERESVYSLAIGQVVEKLILLRAKRGYGLPLHSDPCRAADRLKVAANTTEIRNFTAFCRMAAHQAFGDYLEEKYPERRKLANRIRYLGKSQPHLGLWAVEGETVCGWVQWKTAGIKPKRSERLERLEKDPTGVAHEAIPQEAPRQAKLAVLVGQLLLWVGHPVEFHTLTDAVAEIQGLNDPPLVSPAHNQNAGEDETPDAYAQIATPTQDVAERLQHRIELDALWHGIGRLTRKQRLALLLGEVDQHECIAGMLDTLGIASDREIAEALEIPWDTFARLWRELPLSGERIAEIAGTSPGNIRYQRYEAHQRLQKGFEEPAAKQTEVKERGC